MFWYNLTVKKLPFWLKWGINSLIYVSGITLLLFIINPTCDNAWSGGCWFPLWMFIVFLPTGLVSAPFSLITGNDLWDEFINFGGSFVGGILISVLFYFVIGSLIGWIVGKIKSKRRANLIV